MKKQFTIFALLFSLICSTAFAAKDTLEIKPNTNGLCCWTLTVKNRNAKSKAIDEIRFRITTADGTVFEELKNVTQWTENIFDVTASYVAEVNPIPVGGMKSDFGICLGVQKQDQIINVKWVTYNSLSPIDSGTIPFLCTPTQSYRNDSVSVVPSVVSNNPQFVYTLYNQNDYAIPLSRFVVQLANPTGGTMRPARISAPAGWKLDSVTTLFAYFSTLSPSDYLLSGETKSGFKVTLRGNSSINKFSFAWFAYDEGGALVSRDTLRDIPATFTGSSPDADTIRAANLNGCLYEVTVKNFHVSNQTPISKIRKVALWRKDPSFSFVSAPTTPPFWTKTVTEDSIIFSAPHDSLSIPSGVVNSLFRFTVDAPLTPFMIGWRTYKSLVSTDTLSVGTLNLQCQKEAPKSDTATISNVELCSYILKIYNEHNQPPSNLSAVKISIPSAKGKLSVSFNTLNWNKQSENDTSVTFIAPVGSSQSSGSSQDFLLAISPTTPGEQFPLRWATYDDAAFASGTPLFTGEYAVGCTPPITKCDSVSHSIVQGEQCMNEYVFHNMRDTNIYRILVEVGGGWKIFTAEAPTSWEVQLLNDKTSAEFSIAGVLGIPSDSTLGGFVIKYFRVDSLSVTDTFDVTLKRYDLKEKECVDVLQHICTTTSSKSVPQSEILSSSVTITPNPVSSTALLVLEMETQSRATITLLDVLGRELKVIGSSILAKGKHEYNVMMTGLDEGSYYVRIQTPNAVVTKKIIYVR